MKAVSHCFRVMSIGPWKNSGTSGRALLTKMSIVPNADWTLRNIAVIYLRVRHVRLNHQAVAAASADLLERLVGSTLVLVVMNGDLDTLIRQFERNPSTNPTGARR